MTVLDRRRRRAAALLARCGFAVSLAAFCLSLVVVLRLGEAPGSAATSGGLTILSPSTDSSGAAIPGGGKPLNSGDSATEFTFQLPGGAACTGDSAGQDYRVFSYVLGEGIDPESMVFQGAEGPKPENVGAPLNEFRSPLYDVFNRPYQAAQTANADTPSGPGNVVNLPTFHFETFHSAEFLPAGTYNMGIACVTKTFALDKYWNVKVTFTASRSDTGPVGVTWQAAQTDSGDEVEVELTVDPSSEADVGETVTLTATVDPDDIEGEIQFRDGTKKLGDPVELDDGEAELELDDLAAGEHTFTATLEPKDSDLDEVESDEVDFSVNEVGAGSGSGAEATAVTVTASPADRADIGAPVTFTATVTPAAAAGTVAFFDGETALGEPKPVGGAAGATTASVETATLLEGIRSITARFTPTDTAAYAPSTSSPLSYVVGTATATVASEGSPTGGAGSADAGGPTSGTPLGSLPFTGSSPSLLVWGALSLVFGRMAILLGRTPAILHASST